MLIAIAVVVIAFVLLRYAVYGRSMHAIGVSPAAARLVGIRTKRAILGGASLSGGRGTIIGTVLAVLIIGVLNNGLILLNVPSFWQDVTRGALLFGAVAFDQLRARVTR